MFGGFVRLKVAGPPAPAIDGLARDAAVLIGAEGFLTSKLKSHLFSNFSSQPLSSVTRLPKNKTVFTLLVPVLRYFLHVLVYEPAAWAIIRVPPPPAPKKQRQRRESSRRGAPSDSETVAGSARAAAELPGASDPRRRLVARFAESAWKLSAYVFLLLLGAWAVGGEPWSRVLTGGSSGGAKAAAADALWLGWPLAANPPLPLSLYYLAEGSFYLASLFMLLHWEVRRKDFAAMLTHHSELRFFYL